MATYLATTNVIKGYSTTHCLPFDYKEFKNLRIIGNVQDIVDYSGESQIVYLMVSNNASDYFEQSAVYTFVMIVLL
jgi:hypothetical protein